MEKLRMKAQLDEQSVIKANAQFWEQMLAMKLEAMPSAVEFCVEEGHMLGSVGLSGVEVRGLHHHDFAPRR